MKRIAIVCLILCNASCATLGADCRKWEYTDTSYKQINGKLYKYDESYCKEFK